jgi:4-diphosphocytidyl-2-C-methyl-D-erythritol kinase
MLLRAHAKINLSLHVAGVRPDGYHLLKTVFQTLALHDELAFEAREGALALSCDAPGVPADARNLVWKAAGLVWAAAGRSGEPSGVHVRIAKRIPAQGGLGGGSSDGAAALLAFNAIWRAGLDPRALEVLARRLGADVPFFLHGGTALGLGRGDEIEPMPDLAVRAVVLVFPPFGVSTPEAFRWFDEDAAAPAGTGARLDGFEIANDLQGPVTRRHPEIAEACRALEAAGAEAAAMTGSGSTVFGVFRVPDGARSAAERLESGGWRTLLTATATRAEVRPSIEA